jgi:ABC-type transport system substrate-binding protein/DNA-binding XRE family transcriptional regulator
MTLGQRIEARMKRMGMSQLRLAQKAGLTQQAISSMIHGKSKPSYDTMATLIKALDVTPTWFFEEEDEEESVPLQKEKGQAADERRRFSSRPERGRGRPRKTTFVIGHYLPMQRLQSPFRPNSVHCKFYELMFNSLIETQDGRPRGGLATDWKNLGDSWLFQLRDGVRFQNRKPIKTEDVRWSYEQYLLQNPDQEWLAGVEVIDESLVTLHVKAPCRIDGLRGVYIQPAGAGDSEFIGTGPFQAVELKPGFWRLKKNPHYFRSSPFFDEVQIREYPNPPALEKALLSGEVHLALGVYVPGENFVAHTECAVQRYHLHFMFNQPLMQNRLLRKAITVALDRKELAKAAGLREPRYSTAPFDYIFGDYQTTPPTPDVQTAQEILRVLPDLKGEVLRVNCYALFPHDQPMTEAIVSQLNRVGFRAEIGEDPHLVLATRNVDLLQHELWIWETDSAWNFSGYSAPEVDRLIQQHRQTSLTPDQIRELRALIQRDSPDVPLFYNERALTYVKRLRALENRAPSITQLNEIHTWYFDSGHGR